MRKKRGTPFVESVDESVWYQLAIPPVRLPRKVEMPNAFNFDWSIVAEVVGEAEDAELTGEAGERDGEEAGEPDGTGGADEDGALSCEADGAAGVILTGIVASCVKVWEE